MGLEIRGDQGYVILFHSQHHDKDGQLAYYSVTLSEASPYAWVSSDHFGLSRLIMFVFLYTPNSYINETSRLVIHF